MKSLFIFRRDYRLEDNTGLIRCCKESTEVYPLFVFTPEQIDDNKNSYKSQNSVKILVESLLDLQNRIKKKGGHLNILYGELISILDKFVTAYKIEAIYVNADYTPYSKKRDAKIKALCDKRGLRFVSSEDVCLLPMGTILSDSSKSYYKKFSPFYQKALSMTVPGPVRFSHAQKLVSTRHPDSLASLTQFYSNTDDLIEKGGRTDALKKLKKISQYKDYDDRRNFIDYETTHLSPYIKYGAVSIREVFHTVRNAMGRDSQLLRQLIWRDHFHYIVNYNPESKFLKGYGGYKVKWNKNNDWFKKWKDGTTGYPIVDASMREINTTGYMHNRGRMIVANFLTRILGIDWKLGEKYFAQKLYDYDPIHNNLGWQGQAHATGSEARPVSQTVFNPWTQSGKCDPDGNYIKKWLPELAAVKSRDLHRWDEKHGDYPDIDYPQPMVNYKEQREKILELFRN
jgi:deoxyribodipyrimidine photo-lyase